VLCTKKNFYVACPNIVWRLFVQNQVKIQKNNFDRALYRMGTYREVKKLCFKDFLECAMCIRANRCQSVLHLPLNHCYNRAEQKCMNLAWGCLYFSVDLIFVSLAFYVWTLLVIARSLWHSVHSSEE
jgi:hypothetical protein